MSACIFYMALVATEIQFCLEFLALQISDQFMGEKRHLLASTLDL